MLLPVSATSQAYLTDDHVIDSMNSISISSNDNNTSGAVAITFQKLNICTAYYCECVYPGDVICIALNFYELNNLSCTVVRARLIQSELRVDSSSSRVQVQDTFFQFQLFVF